jgi:murein DD-endopeptidase MepM/ murein hydrolase activator NlpD
MVTPSNTGEGRTALADTRAAWVNLRSGPGTGYADVGDIRDNTLVFYYPDTRQGDWVYLQQYGLAGWVHTGFVQFVPVAADPPTAPDRPTPYDGHIGMWHWQGGAVQESTIEQLVSNLKRRVSNVTQLFIKTSEGTSWQGEFDSKPNLAVNGPEDLTRWGEVLQRYGIALNAWCVPRGIGSIQEEARVMIETCNHPMVNSLILDVEPYQGYWDGTQAQIRELMIAVRRGIPADFHIGLSVDPRPWHYASIYPESWKPFVNSLHPQVYWVDFSSTPEASLQQMYETWLQYGVPVVPLLQVTAPVNEIRGAHGLATARFGAKALNWWRYGVGTTAELNALNLPIPDSDVEPLPLPDPDNGGGNSPPDGDETLVDEILITPGDADFARGTYTTDEQFRAYVQRMGWQVYYTQTEPRQSSVWAMWTPKVEISGEYAIDVYIHKPFSTTNNARYRVYGVRGEDEEVLVSVNQSNNTDGWHRLGVFDFDSNLPNAGRVFLNNATGEQSRYITFDAIRWRRAVTLDLDGDVPNATENGMIIKDGVVYCDGFDSPVGNQRNSGDRTEKRVWPVGWRDASPYAEPYLFSSYLGRYTSVHTGADLNWGSGAYDDVGQEIYSIASGIVVFSNFRPSWGNLVVIQHDPYIRDGRRVASRYAHMIRVDVKVGDRVGRGEVIGTLGGTPNWVPHLHVDVMPASTMERNVEDWPAGRYMDGKTVSTMTNAEYQTWVNSATADILKNYFDPKLFIQNNRPNRGQ